MTDKEEIVDMLEGALRDYNGTWRHYKGGVYQVTEAVWDTNVEDVALLYKRIDGPGYDHIKEIRIVFSRPVAEWNDPTSPDPSSNPTGQPYRFVRVTKQEVWTPVPVQLSS